MPRYIDADRIDMNQVTVYDYKEQKWTHVFDIPEDIVRCKECESWGLNAIKKDEKGEAVYGDCLHFCVSTPKGFYCAWAERRKDD